MLAYERNIAALFPEHPFLPGLDSPMLEQALTEFKQITPPPHDMVFGDSFTKEAVESHAHMDERLKPLVYANFFLKGHLNDIDMAQMLPFGQAKNSGYGHTSLPMFRGWHSLIQKKTFIVLEKGYKRMIQQCGGPDIFTDMPETE